VAEAATTPEDAHCRNQSPTFLLLLLLLLQQQLSLLFVPAASDPVDECVQCGHHA
jgi:hypothetical protein